MAVETQSMVLRWGVDLDDSTAGLCVLTDVVRERLAAGVSASRSEDWAYCVRLATGKVTGQLRTPVRSLGAWSSWGRAEICCLATTGISFRATDGTTTYYWTGSAWAAATTSAHWSAASTAWAAMPSWSKSSLGWIFKLDRASTSVASPRLYGVKAVVRILFADSSGDVTRPSSWDDDLVHRVFLGQAATALSISASAEKVVATGFAYLDYSKGVEDWPFNVTGVDAVYCVTDDPTLRTPLAGTWNATTKRWTPTTIPAAGKKLHVLFRHSPDLAYTGMSDYVLNRLPAVLVESASLTTRHCQHGADVVVDPASKDCVAVDNPCAETWSLSCRVVAARTTDASRIGRAAERWLRDGVCVVSPGTSLPVRLTLESSPRPGSRTGDAVEVRFSVRADVETWTGQELTGVTVQTVVASFDDQSEE